MPFAVVDSLGKRGIAAVILALKGACDPAQAARFRHHWISVGQIGKATRLLRSEGCREVIFIGSLARPALSDIRLDWGALRDPRHAGLARWVEDLNRCYRAVPALYEQDFDAAGFEWVDAQDAEASVLSYLRKARDGSTVLVVANFTPVPRDNYLVGVPHAGYWAERLNSDAALYGGSGVGNQGGVHSVPVSAHGRYHALNLTLPPLGVLFLAPEGVKA